MMTATTTTMEQHWQSLKADRSPLCPQRFARCVAEKWTKHTDFAVITAALADWCDARDEYVAAYRAGSEAIDAATTEEERRLPAPERFYPEHARRVHAAMAHAFEIAPSANRPGGGRGSVEAYPLARWAKEAATFRRGAKIIFKTL